MNLLKGHLLVLVFLLINNFILSVVNCFSQNSSIQSVFTNANLPTEHVEPLREYTADSLSQTVPFSSRNSFAAPVNDMFSQATSLIPNAACTSGVLDQSTTESWEPLTTCGATAFIYTVWYRFVANASSMFVQMNTSGFAGNGASWIPGNWASSVYRVSSPSPLTLASISCKTVNSQGGGASGADGIMIHYLSGLTVNSTYYIQVGYTTSNGAALIPNFCIKVGSQFTPNCDVCSSPCGSACGFATAPTVAQVTSSCYAYYQSPYLEGAVSDTQCYTFYTSGTTATFGVIINSTCGTGNVTNFTWNLYALGCGAPVQSGILPNLTFTGLSPNRQYTFCYSFTVPSNCYHTAYWPYFVGVQPLPVKLINFEGKFEHDGNKLSWTTATELNNEKFILERSIDGLEFIRVGEVMGKGTTSEQQEYHFTDLISFSPLTYYRLIQVDFDGAADTSEVIAVQSSKRNLSVMITPNPCHGLPQIKIQNPLAGREAVILITDLTGNEIRKTVVQMNPGLNIPELSFSPLAVGSYLLHVTSDQEIFVQRLMVLN